jgi:hypothetical protein
LEQKAAIVGPLPLLFGLKRSFLHRTEKEKRQKLWRKEDPPLFVIPPNLYQAQLGRRLTLESLEA